MEGRSVPKEHPTVPGVYIETNKVVDISELSDTDPVLYVNGSEITKRDFEALLRLRDGVWRIAGRLPLDATDEEMEEYRYKAGPGIMLQLIHHELFRQYAEEIGAVPTDDAVKAAGEVLLTNLR